MNYIQNYQFFKIPFYYIFDVFLPFIHFLKMCNTEITEYIVIVKRIRVRDGIQMNPSFAYLFMYACVPFDERRGFFKKRPPWRGGLGGPFSKYVPRYKYEPLFFNSFVCWNVIPYWHMSIKQNHHWVSRRLTPTYSFCHYGTFIVWYILFDS